MEGRWHLCTKTMKKKHWIWTTGFSPEKSTNPASGDRSGLLPGISIIWGIFHFLLYISGDFGYNKSKYAKIKEMRDRIHEH